jgi:hypothetical protein
MTDSNNIEEMNLTKLSKRELLAKCEILGLTKYKSKNKGELIELINSKTHIEFIIESEYYEDIITQDDNVISIENSNFDTLKNYYDNVLNLDKTTYKSSNDEPTPIQCIVDMIDKIPVELWMRNNLSILDPCCGNGNFVLPVLFKLLNANHTTKNILENIIEFNDIY